MRTGAILLAACLAGAVFTAQERFHSGIDLVRLPVVVSAGGTLVTGLRAEDFEVREDGRVEPITFFEAGAAGTTVPLHLGVLLDVSESMETSLVDAANACIKIIRSLETAADVTFVDFDSQIRLGFFSPPNDPRLFARIRGAKAKGTTALFDAVARYVDRAVELGGDHILLLYSDGGDTTSSISYGDLEKRLRAANVLVYAMGYFGNAEGPETMRGRVRLTQMAHDTGGEVFFPTGKGDIEGLDKRIIAEVQGRYTLGYVSSNLHRDGAWRKVQVRLLRPDLHGMTLRTRPGYFGPS